MKNNYNSVLRPNLSKSFFNLSYTKIFDCDAGQLIPVYLEELVPGDRFKISNQALIRFQPLVAPVMGGFSVLTEYFFIPCRLLWDDWVDFYTGGIDGEEAPSLPLWDDYLETPAEKYTLWDYFGLPLHLINSEQCPIDLPRTAYNLVWNYFYRDENIDEEVDLKNNNVLMRRWKKDYFTSALPFQQRGIAPSIPLTGSASVSWANNIPVCSLGYSTLPDSGESFLQEFVPVGTGSDYTYKVKGTGDVNTFNSGLFVKKDGGDYGFSGGVNKHIFGINENNSVDLTNIGTFNMSDFRYMAQVQQFLEVSSFSGARFEEFLYGHFGIAPKSEVLQEPVFIGSSANPLLVSEVLQTSSSDEVSPQGNLAGRGVGVSDNYVCKWTAKEPGYILGIMSIVPNSGYASQGISKMWTRRSRYSFYFPEFSHLSEQPVFKGELFQSGTDKDLEVFGYQGIYDEYRHRRNDVSGAMRDDFAFWHTNRIFEGSQALNSEFLEMSMDKRIFAVPSEPGFVVEFLNDIKAVRPMPKFATPGRLRF